MSSRGGFDAYRQSVLGGRASPCGARLTFSSGQASGSVSLSLRVSLSESLRSLSALSLSLGPFFSLRHTPLPKEIDFSKSGFGSSLSLSLSVSLSLSLSHTHTKRHRHWKIGGEKNKESSKFFLYQKQRPAIAAKCKEDWEWNGLIPPYVERARANVNKCVSWRGVGGETLAQSIVVRDNFC